MLQQRGQGAGGGRRQHYYAQLLKESGLRREHLVCPVFVSEQDKSITDRSIEAMPGMELTPLSAIGRRMHDIVDGAGIRSVILFGIPKVRDGSGSAAYDEKGVVQRAVREIKSAFGRSANVVTDVCVCQYNLSGHCGVTISADSGNKVDNDATIRLLARIAKSHADAGADIVAPSAMMDGQVQAIKEAIAGISKRTRILSYSAKHASSLYAPFRSAAFAAGNGEESAIKKKIDKAPYQVSYSNPRQAMREIEQDISEGADMVMVKPGMAYLDLVRMAKERFAGVPVAVQNVSGEYAMVKAAARRGWIDEEEWKAGSLASMRRAGADMIISYFALEVARYLRE